MAKLGRARPVTDETATRAVAASKADAIRAVDATMAFPEWSRVAPVSAGGCRGIAEFNELLWITTQDGDLHYPI
ncbi:MAG: hypothetical protein CMP09_11395 [Yangia sp.]|nr:hypothetical protein [Salipiger sp.]